MPTTLQLEPASPPAAHGFIPVRHALTQVVPSKEKPLLQLQEYPVFGATASVQVALVLPPVEHGLPVQAFLSVHDVVPVPVYAGLLQVQV